MKIAKRSLTFAFAIFACATAMASEAADPSDSAELQCNLGPLHKTFGGTHWLVYACDDKRSVVIVSDEASPAAPFFFMLIVSRERDLTVHGEGTGSKAATQAAFDDIKQLSEGDVASLVAQAEASAQKTSK